VKQRVWVSSAGRTTGPLTDQWTIHANDTKFVPTRGSTQCEFTQIRTEPSSQHDFLIVRAQPWKCDHHFLHAREQDKKLTFALEFHFCILLIQWSPWETKLCKTKHHVNFQKEIDCKMQLKVGSNDSCFQKRNVENNQSSVSHVKQNGCLVRSNSHICHWNLAKQQQQQHRQKQLAQLLWHWSASIWCFKKWLAMFTASSIATTTSFTSHDCWTCTIVQMSPIGHLWSTGTDKCANKTPRWVIVQSEWSNRKLKIEPHIQMKMKCSLAPSFGPENGRCTMPAKMKRGQRRMPRIPRKKTQHDAQTTKCQRSSKLRRDLVDAPKVIKLKCWHAWIATLQDCAA